MTISTASAATGLARLREHAGSADPEPGQTARGTAPAVMVPGASAAELAVMREAAAAFARRLTAGSTCTAANGLGMLASSFTPPPATGREEYVSSGSSHWCASTAAA